MSWDATGGAVVEDDRGRRYEGVWVSASARDVNSAPLPALAPVGRPPAGMAWDGKCGPIKKHSEWAAGIFTGRWARIDGCESDEDSACGDLPRLNFPESGSWRATTIIAAAFWLEGAGDLVRAAKVGVP